MDTVSDMFQGHLETNEGTFKYTEKKIESRYGHLIIWSSPSKTWCLVVAIAIFITVAIWVLFRDHAEIIHRQSLARIGIYRDLFRCRVFTL